MARKSALIKYLNDLTLMWKLTVRIIEKWYMKNVPKQSHLENCYHGFRGTKSILHTFLLFIHPYFGNSRSHILDEF